MAERILITGISGFIAKHIALQAIGAGYAVRGTVRKEAAIAPVQQTLARHGAAIDTLQFAIADLTQDRGWAEAMAGCAAVMHVAAPFPLKQPREREALVPAARDGALRVLRAAQSSGVPRIVLTSSIVAMSVNPKLAHDAVVTESDWSDPDWPLATPYAIAKTRAEQAAWAHMRASGRDQQFTAINPGLVLGPALDRDIGTSLDVVRLLMSGAYPAVPPISFAICDVRDVAAAHLAVLRAPATGGRRIAVAGALLSMKEIGRIIKDAMPEYARKVPTAVVPAWMVRLMAVFDPALKSVASDLGNRRTFDTAPLTTLTGLRLRSAKQAVIAAARSLIDEGVL